MIPTHIVTGNILNSDDAKPNSRQTYPFFSVLWGPPLILFWEKLVIVVGGGGGGGGGARIGDWGATTITNFSQKKMCVYNCI